MSTLAHVFEEAGIATVVLASIRAVAEKMHPPRTLYCEFPLGRPLGKPNDAEFQQAVLNGALALFERDAGPVLEDHPQKIALSDAEPLACPLPPRFDPGLAPAVDEARALRDAYNRAVSAAGRTSVGRAVSADAVPDALESFVRISEGTPWNEAGIPGNPIEVAHDIRSYYEELAVELADGPPGPWAAERWFYDSTEGGKAILAARRSMKEAKAPFPLWFYLAPGPRS